MYAAIVVIAEKPHITHHEPNQSEGIYGIAEVLYSFQGLPPVVQPAYSEEWV